MAKLKNAVIRAREAGFDGYMSNYQLIVAARACLRDAIENPEADEGLVSAERALALINTYLCEGGTCKH